MSAGLLKFHNAIMQSGSKDYLFHWKYYNRWKKYLEPGRSSVTDRQPWITFHAIDILSSFLTTSAKVFEYGGGGSTLFFLDRVSEVFTVEHNKEWYNRLSGLIKNSKWKGHLIMPEVIGQSSGDISDPGAYLSDDEDSKGQTFKAYASAIDQYNILFDVVLVDGRSRPSCIMHGMPKIKHGGLLVVDNSDRPYYLKAFTKTLSDDYILLTDSVTACPYLTHFTKTSIWRKK